MWQYLWGSVMSFTKKAFIGHFDPKYLNPLFSDGLISDLTKLDLASASIIEGDLTACSINLKALSNSKAKL